MTEEAIADNAPIDSPIPDSPVVVDPAAGEAGASEAPPATEVPATEDNGFKLPDEYKDKPWAEKVKSQEDLYKQVDNLTSLAGKKHAYPGEDSTPEQMTEYFQGLRPESADAYDFGEDHAHPEVAKQFGELLFNSNVSAHQSKGLIEGYNALEEAATIEATSAEGLEKIMTEKFGEKYDVTMSSISENLKKYVSKEDVSVVESMPNQYLGPVYKAFDDQTKAYEAKIADILKTHGANEAGDSAHNEKGAPPAEGVSVEAKRTEIRNKMFDLDKTAHTAAQKQELQSQLDATYRG